MEPDSSASADADSKARKQRMDAIRSLTVAPTQGGMATHEHQQQEIGQTLLASSGARRRTLMWGGAVLLIGIIIAVILSSLFRGSSVTPPTAARSLEVIQFPHGSLSCPLGASWAPDGKLIAVVGYATCSSQVGLVQGTHPLISLYNVATGRETAVLSLESALTRDVTHGAALDAYQLGLETPVWTPNGQIVGLPFALSPTVHPDQVIFGLAILHLTGSASAIAPTTPLGHVGVTFDTYSLSSTVPPLVVRFDTANGSAAIISPSPAFLYHWDANGVLTPNAQPGAQAQTLPASISGRITYVCSLSPDASARGNSAYYWISAGGSAWSPDGRYFFSTLGAYGRLANAPSPVISQPASGSQQSCAVAGPATKWPSVTLPVGGFDSAERELDPYSNDELTFVTSPGGSRVAVSEIVPAINNSDPSSIEQAISVYDTATGKFVARFDAPQLLKQAHVTTNQGGEVFPTMSWSPNAGSLALLDIGDHALLILRTADLVS